MREELVKIRQNFDEKIKGAEKLQDFVALEKEFLGKGGALKKILGLLKTLDEKEKRAIGKNAGDLRIYIRSEIDKKKKAFLSERKSMAKEIDISLPGKKMPQGHLHPLTQTLQMIKKVFESMGFSVFLTPEIETEFYNFDSLNVPEDHPARDLWDTFWLEDNQKLLASSFKLQDSKSERLLLRTHTTAMQLRYMEKHNPPFRIISPGKCFRYEASNNTHDIQFIHTDGLMVDKDVSIANFKAVIEELFRRIFSDKIEVRVRPGYFPFVEPGFEVDIACYKCQGKNCPICKGKGWLEIMGAGMVHPEILKRAGFNPAHWQGFAFGMGVDRIAMIKYGISDIRLFYQNDLRFLKQF